MRDYCRSKDGVYAEHILHFIGDAPSDPLLFAMSCGLSAKEVRELRNLLCVGQSSIDIDEAFSFDFKAGAPAITCRPYRERELKLMKYHMLSGVPKGQSMPAVIIISGLPAAGKSSICQHVLETVIGIRACECVNIDMDIARTFHSQFMNYSRENDGAGARTFQSYDGLVQWFMEGTNLECALYSHPDGVVQSLLRDRCNFVLATVMDQDRTLQFLQCCVTKHHYRPYLIGVHVATDTALARASERGQMTGRFTPASIIEGRDEAVKAVFAKTARFVASAGGSVFLFNNNDCGRSFYAKEVFRLQDGAVKIQNDHSLALEYGLDPDLPFSIHAVTKTAGESLPSAPTDDRDAYNNLGFCILKSCLNAELVRKLGADFEASIANFAKDTNLSLEEYLSVINKWPHWNAMVMYIMEVFGPLLRRIVESILGCDVAHYVGAVIFRKSSLHGNKPTHLHQDIAYARFPGSQLFRATTWIPLVLHNADTLAFQPGSHKRGIQSMSDILLPHTQSSFLDNEEVVANITLGDALLFDARTLHRSTMFPECGTESLRLAIGIQWSTAGGLDGLENPGSYYRYPPKDIPAYVDVEGMRRNKTFGMDTAGWFLKRALVKVSAENDFQNSDFSQLSDKDVEKYSTLKLAEAFARDGTESKEKLHAAGCTDIGKAQLALKKYVLMRQAAQKHFGEAQGPAIFESIYNWVVKPVLLLK